MKITNAVPVKSLAVPPYQAEKFSNQWSGVMNANGVNCLTFPGKPGAVVTDHDSAIRIAVEWNNACGVA